MVSKWQERIVIIFITCQTKINKHLATVNFKVNPTNGFVIITLTMYIFILYLFIIFSSHTKYVQRKSIVILLNDDRRFFL